MSEHRYILEPYKGMNTRYNCPVCQQKDKTFSLYIDTETGEHINPRVGRCNRESNCGYHYTPKEYFQDNNISFDASQVNAYKPRTVTTQPKPVSFIPVEEFKASLNPLAFETNHFVQFLINLFGDETTNKLISKYFIGSSNHWPGSTIFWQVDISGQVRTGKIMLYSPITGKRVKEPYNHITWVHKDLQEPEFNLKQCLFGEHLLIDKEKPVALVESEKTAIIASVYFPEFIWLSVGNLNGLSIEKCKPLQGRKVFLFPDLKGFQKWSDKAEELSAIGTFIVSDMLEKLADDSERENGCDIADYLIQFDLNEFKKSDPEIKEIPVIETYKFIEDLPIIETKVHELWDDQIQDLESFFHGKTFKPGQLDQCTLITDPALFIDSHLSNIKANNGNRTFLPYLHRLQNFKNQLN